MTYSVYTMNLNGKNVVYIGGFGGIGYASCIAFLQHGIANLMILDLHEDTGKLDSLRAIDSAAKVDYLRLDLMENQSAIEAIFHMIQTKLGRIDILVNGSGIMNEHEIERTVRINLLGVIHCTFAAMAYMDKSRGGNGGVIVNISSVVGLDAYGGYAVYTATKYGLNGFGRALADPFYYEQTLIKFITICPSTTETPMLAALRHDPVTTFPRRPPLPTTLRNHQTAEECGSNLVEIIKTAGNGSFWILCNGKYCEYKFPEIEVMSKV